MELDRDREHAIYDEALAGRVAATPEELRFIMDESVSRSFRILTLEDQLRVFGHVPNVAFDQGVEDLHDQRVEYIGVGTDETVRDWLDEVRTVEEFRRDIGSAAERKREAADQALNDYQDIWKKFSAYVEAHPSEFNEQLLESMEREEAEARRRLSWPVRLWTYRIPNFNLWLGPLVTGVILSIIVGLFVGSSQDAINGVVVVWAAFGALNFTTDILKGPK